MKKIDTILFDLDGTILDTAPDLGKALNIILKKHYRKPLPFDLIRPQASAGTKALLALGFQVVETDPIYAELREQFLSTYHDHLFDHTEIFPGVGNVLKHLNNYQIPWGIVTNKPENLAKQLLDYFDLSQQCQCVVGGDTLTKRKPDPEPLLHACGIIGTRSENTIYIGDAARDIQAAKSANMPVIAALYGYIGEHEDPFSWNADYYIRHPEEIIALLRDD